MASAQESQPQPAVFVETYGCQMNVLDSQLVGGQLAGLGYRLVKDASEADVVLLNTCSVRELSEHKVWSHLGRLGVEKKSTRPNLIVGVLGCMAEREGAEILRRMPYVDLVCSPSLLDQVPELITRAKERGEGQLAIAGHGSRRSATLEAAMDGVETLDLSRAFSPLETGSQAFVRITRGCNKFCSFCVVPYTRGPEVHRAPAQIIEEVRRLVERGAQEVTLLGQTVNHYVYKDGGKTTTFADLLALVHDAVPELPRLRFVTSYPRDFSDHALDVMAQSPRICRYLHIPAQSGSNRLLGLMNRGYDIETYLGLIERARARMPDIRLAGDMIVGFPTETEDEHQASLRLVERVGYKNLFVFKYSPRPATVAERRLVDDVDEETKKRRNIEMLDLQNSIALAQNRARIGETCEVLVESTSKLRQHDTGVKVGWQARSAGADLVRLVGRTRGDEIVAFDGPADLVGKLVSVRIREATALTLLADQLCG